MRHSTLFLTSLAAVTVVAGSASAIPLGLDITISDGNFRGTGWYGNHEDNETETNPDTLQGQLWDLEGMFMQGTALTLVGGYNFKNGVTHGGHNYGGGDIFIDVNGNAVFGQAANGGSGVGGNTTNLFGYDYVMDLNFSTMTFDLVELTPGSVVNRGTVVASSNPWRYVSGGTSVAGFQDVAFSYLAGLSNADVGGLQGHGGNNQHFAITLDTSFLPAGDAVFHYTMECGNDNLMGLANVPDAASTAALLGVSLLGLAGIRRRRK